MVKIAAITVLIVCTTAGIVAFSGNTLETKEETVDGKGTIPVNESATFGGGCFWCTDAVFQQLNGVQSVKSGYAGGPMPNPSYRAICSGMTGHAEVVQITFDPEVISFTNLLEVFWQSHDPTTLNRQGFDIGSQYRSIVLYHNDQQKQSAEQAIEKLNRAGVFRSPVVTEIAPYTEFYEADPTHQDYYLTNSNGRYCTQVIEPKLQKIRKVFAELVKPGS
ncbi:MAG: peptide-methionine (S)-S-oxide reductase MsrA [Planctomycetales bacterium]